MPDPRYRLGRFLRRGGTANVHEGFQAYCGIERRVAIKHALDGDPTKLERFIHEARLASQLHHPGIIPVIDYGELDGRPFQVQEFVHGLDLRQALAVAEERGRPMPVAVAVYVAAQLGRALHYAHQARDASGTILGIVHRDVCPQNVMVSWQGDVRLGDFGNAFSLQRGQLTKVGVVHGTLDYMSPEQARGENVGAEADVFALACVLHRMLAGQSPLEGLSLEGLRVGRIPPLSEDISVELRPILATALSSRRENRHRSAEGFAEACESACPESLQARAKLATWMGLSTTAPKPVDSEDPQPARGVYEIQPGSRQFKTAVVQLFEPEATERSSGLFSHEPPAATSATHSASFDSEASQATEPPADSTAETFGTTLSEATASAGGFSSPIAASLGPIAAPTRTLVRTPPPSAPRGGRWWAVFVYAALASVAAAVAFLVQSQRAAPVPLPSHSPSLAPVARALPVVAARTSSAVALVAGPPVEAAASAPEAGAAVRPSKRKARAPVLSKRSADPAMRARVRAALHGAPLVEADLSAEQWEPLLRAEEAADAASLAREEAELLAWIRDFRPDRPFLERKLLRLKSLLADASEQLSLDVQGPLEEQLMDLRAALGRASTDAQRSHLAEELVAFETKIRAAHRPR